MARVEDSKRRLIWHRMFHAYGAAAAGVGDQGVRSLWPPTYFVRE
jgi:hypothetical protein